MPHGQDAGFLGKAHDPFVLMADPSKPNFKVPRPVASRFDRRSAIATPKEVAVDRRRDTVQSFEKSEDARLLDASFRIGVPNHLEQRTHARRLTFPKSPQKVRERYGMTRFGQCCLVWRAG